MTVSVIDNALVIGGQTVVDPREAPLNSLANVIWVDWRERSKSGIYFGAEPYITAMMGLSSIDGRYGEDDGHSIVAYFLSNASSWRGDVARLVKAELKRRCRYA